MKTKRHFHIKGKTLKLTHLFKWYKKDFEEAAGSVKKFIAPYLEDEDSRKKLEDSKDIDFIDYDWKLNRPENFVSK